MGEIADMMLDGSLDCETGEYIGPGDGYPRTRNRAPTPKTTKKVRCGQCQRMVTATGLADHTRVMHAQPPKATPGGVE